MPAQKLRFGACMLHTSFAVQRQQCTAKPRCCVAGCDAIPDKIRPSICHDQWLPNYSASFACMHSFSVTEVAGLWGCSYTPNFQSDHFGFSSVVTVAAGLTRFRSRHQSVKFRRANNSVHWRRVALYAETQAHNGGGAVQYLAGTQVMHMHRRVPYLVYGVT